MRLFCGIDLPADVLLRIDGLLSTLRPIADIKWSRIENLHVTTKFIGEWPEERMAELTGVLQTLPMRQAFPVYLHGLGWFPDASSPAVLWAGVDGGKPLLDLAAAIDAALTPLGIPVESRPFTPHLTLARLKARPAYELRAKVKASQSITFGNFSVDCVYLYESQPGTRHSSYRKLSEYPFQP